MQIGHKNGILLQVLPAIHSYSPITFENQLYVSFTTCVMGFSKHIPISVEYRLPTGGYDIAFKLCYGNDST